ncbi:unnamed protein product, partial [Mesorhabditis spiculigera]
MYYELQIKIQSRWIVSTQSLPILARTQIVVSFVIVILFMELVGEIIRRRLTILIGHQVIADLERAPGLINPFYGTITRSMDHPPVLIEAINIYFWNNFSGSTPTPGHPRVLVKGHTTGGTPRQFSTASTLNRRHGRSCDLHEVQAEGAEFKPLFNNPIAQVSSDILKVQGYSTQFRSLLSARLSPRRDSVPNVHIQDSNTELETKSG